MAACVAAFAALVLRLHAPIGSYDEGILLADAGFVHDGALPHRDFYTNYPPGIFFAIAGLWKAFGISILVERVLGLALHLAAALIAGKLAGRLRSERFSFFAASAVLFWAAGAGLAPRAWLAAMVAALAFAWFLWSALESSRLAPWFRAGVALGCVGGLRHDLFGYIGIVAALIAGARWATTRSEPRGPWIRRVASLSAGAATVLALVYVPVLATAGTDRVVRDLFVEQSRVLAARTLPLFTKWGLRGYQWMFALEAAVPLAAGFVLVRRGWSNGVAVVGGLALAVLPAAAGRSDAVHVIGCSTPALVLASACGLSRLESASSSRVRWAIATAMVGTLVVPAPHLLSFRAPRGEAVAERHSRYGGVMETVERRRAREEVLDYVRDHSRPDEAIFVGTRTHDVVFVNEVELYFLAERRGATRWMQFDPNLTNRLDVQQEIAADLDRARAPLVVLCDCCYRDEGSGNGNPGAHWLDEYLALKYAPALETGPYLVLRRIEASGR